MQNREMKFMSTYGKNGVGHNMQNLSYAHTYKYGNLIKMVA